MTTWFITGTSSGFGRGLTEQLLARGDSIAATLRAPEKLHDLKSRYGAALWIATLDVTDSGAVRQVIDDAFAALGHIDVIISNAGYGLFGAAEEVTDAQIRHQLDTNLIGSIQVIRAALPHLRAQGGGRILQLSSEGGQIAYPNFGLYHASKWGIEGFVEAVAQEVAPFGIQMTLVEPGPTGTDFGAGLVNAPAMAEYARTPSGELRQLLERALSGQGPSEGFTINGDSDKMVQAIIACALQPNPPRRLLLGSTAYTHVYAWLTARLAELEAQKETACAMDLENPA